jgi:2-polyprenyl-3-methyl-5-hydroxy-6-metoxy-1,4-benzoquinol methylase
VARNIHDDPTLPVGHGAFPRSREGREGREGLLGTAGWPAFGAMLADLKDLGVVDPGCGFGPLSRWLSHEGARSVLALDRSEAMERTRRSPPVPTGARPSWCAPWSC